MAVDRTLEIQRSLTAALHQVYAVAPFEIAIVISQWALYDESGVTDADGPRSDIGPLRPIAGEDAAAYGQRLALGLFKLLKEV